MPPQARATMVLVALLAVTAAAGAAGPGADYAWNQLGGDAHRSGVARLPAGTLDVVATYRFLPDEWRLIGFPSLGLVWTPHGAVGVAYRGEPGAGAECRLVRLEDFVTGENMLYGPTIRCDDGARVVGYDAARDAVLVCIDGLARDVRFAAWDAATGEERWSRTPSIPPAEPPGARDFNDWYCEGVIIAPDGETAIVPFSQEIWPPGRHSIEAFRLADGSLLWATNVPATAFEPPLCIGICAPAAPDAATDQASSMVVLSLTLTDSGFVAMGVGGRGGYAAMAWFDLAGQRIGAATASTGDVQRDEDRGVAYVSASWAASLGPLAAAPMGDRLFVVNPLNAAGTSYEIPSEELASGTAPVWSREGLVVPLRATAVLYDATPGSEPRTWPGFEGGRILEATLAPPGTAYVTVGRDTGSGDATDVIRIDLASAKSVQRLPVPVDYAAPELVADNSVHLLPLPGDAGVLVWSQNGGAALLATRPTAARPVVEIDRPYPAVGATASLTVEEPDGTAPDAVLLAWGDGVLETLAAEATASHVYAEEGQRIVRATALYADHRTATTEIVVNVGGTPPQDLNFLQTAFAPENQDVTFGVLGLGLTIIGAVATLALRTRRRGVLGEGLAALEAIRDRARGDAVAAFAALGLARERLRRDLAEGRIDDTQFGVLDLRATQVLDVVRQRILGPVAGKLSPGFRSSLEAALQDGRIDAAEATDLRAALANEKRLSAGERERLKALLEAGSEPHDAATTR